MPKKNILILALWTHHNLLTVGPASTESMKVPEGLALLRARKIGQSKQQRIEQAMGKDLVSTKIDAGLSQNYY